MGPDLGVFKMFVMLEGFKFLVFDRVSVPLAAATIKSAHSEENRSNETLFPLFVAVVRS